MENRWSDAARTAALAVRQARALAGKPVAGVAKAKPKKAMSAPKPNPMVYAGGSATFDERTGKRNNKGPNIWIPPPDSPYWKDEKWVAAFKKTVAERKKSGTAGSKTIPPPNIFYSSSYPYGPGQEGTRGILRYDPSWPDMAEDLGYNMGPDYEKRRKQREKWPRPSSGGSRVVIGGRIYIRVGNKMVPYRTSATGGADKVYYQKG
jgi:hypothetical protein